MLQPASTEVTSRRSVVVGTLGLRRGLSRGTDLGCSSRRRSSGVVTVDPRPRGGDGHDWNHRPSGRCHAHRSGGLPGEATGPRRQEGSGRATASCSTHRGPAHVNQLGAQGDELRRDIGLGDVLHPRGERHAPTLAASSPSAWSSSTPRPCRPLGPPGRRRARSPATRGRPSTGSDLAACAR